MFFTSALTPRGSPGSCTDTLASTLIWPSAEVEKTQTERVGGAGSVQKGRRRRLVPDMLPWQVPMACRMSCSSLIAAAASSPQLMSGSITSSMRPTPDTREDRSVLHLWSSAASLVQRLWSCVWSYLLCWGRWTSGYGGRREDSCRCPAPAGSVWSWPFSGSPGSFSFLQRGCTAARRRPLWAAAAEWSGIQPESVENERGKIQSRLKIWMFANYVEEAHAESSKEGVSTVHMLNPGRKGRETVQTPRWS